MPRASHIFNVLFMASPPFSEHLVISPCPAFNGIPVDQLKHFLELERNGLATEYVQAQLERLVGSDKAGTTDLPVAQVDSMLGPMHSKPLGALTLTPIYSQTDRYTMEALGKRPAPLVLTLIRHCEALHNVRSPARADGSFDRPYADVADPPLTSPSTPIRNANGDGSTGAEQAAALAEVLALGDEAPFDLIVVSPMRRALETCAAAFQLARGAGGRGGTPCMVQPLCAEQTISAQAGHGIAGKLADVRVLLQTQTPPPMTSTLFTSKTFFCCPPPPRPPPCSGDDDLLQFPFLLIVLFCFF